MPGGIDLDVPESATSKTSESIIFNLIEKRTKLFDTCSGDRIKSTFFLRLLEFPSMLLIILLLGIMKIDSLFVAELLKTLKT